MRESFEPEIIRKIVSLITQHPGMDLSRLASLLNMKALTVESYLGFLEGKGQIESKIQQGYRCYYVQEKKGSSRFDRRTQETRQQIYEVVADNPGIHLSRIAERLAMSPSLTEYHLLQLERNNLIMGVREDRGYYKRYFISESDVGVREKRILALLRHQSFLKIVVLLIRHECLRHKEFLAKLDVAPSTVSYNLSRLIDGGIVEVVSYGKEKGYSLKDVDEIVGIVRKYKLALILDSFKDMWKDLNLL